MSMTAQELNFMMSTNNEAVKRGLLVLRAQGVLKNRFHKSLADWVYRGRELSVKQLQAVRKGDQFGQYIEFINKAIAAKAEVQRVVEEFDVNKAMEEDCQEEGPFEEAHDANGNPHEWNEERDGDYGNWAEDQMIQDEMRQEKAAFAAAEYDQEQAAFEAKMHRIGK